MVSEPASTSSRVNQLHPVALPASGWHGAPLPVSGTSFVGREHEIRYLGDLLSREGVRLVTLTGPGGVGKSRLGLQVARQLAERFADGVAFVDLAHVPGGSGIATLISGAMGVRDVTGKPTVDRLADVMHNREMLLFLDGFEPHVAEAMLLAELLGRCARPTILVTSREPLRLSAERVMPVVPLAVQVDGPGADAADGDAVRLFIERAQAVAPSFTVDDTIVTEVAAIVRALDGLPLAIELAAARLTHLTPQALLQRLDRRMTLLTGGALDLPERHQTLRRSIAWSHDLLTLDEQAGFRRLAVFVRGFTLDAAGQVVGLTSSDSVDVVDLIGSLVSRSLIRRVEGCEGEPRFDMLDTLREFAAEQLEAAGEITRIRDRHAAWFVEFAERADASIWGGPDHVLWLDRLEADIENLRSALAWLDETDQATSLLRLASALGGLWHYRSHRVEGRRWLRAVLGQGDLAVSSSLAMAHIKLGMMERELGGRDAVDLVEEGLRLRRLIGDRRPIGRALMNLGNVLKDQNGDARALDALEEAERILREAGDIGGLATTIMYVGIVAFDRGDLDVAETRFIEALALHRQDGFTLGEARTVLMLGRVAVAKGEIARGATSYASSLDLWLRVRNVEGLVDALVAVAALAVDRDRPDLAATLLGAGDTLRDVIGYVPPPRWQTAWDLAVHACRANLGELGYEVAHGAGSQLSGVDAVIRANDLLEPLIGRDGGAAPLTGTMFTPREHDVLRLLVEGRSDREIARELNLKYRTVTSHVRNILDKLDVTSRTAAATRSVREGLV